MNDRQGSPMRSVSRRSAPGRLRRLASLALSVALTSPTIANAQLALNDAIAIAAEQNPGLRTTLLELQRADRLVVAEEARYGFTFLANGSLSLGDSLSLNSPRTDSTTGMLIAGRTASSYSEQVDLSVGLRRNFEWGTVIELEAAGGRQLRRAFFIPNQAFPIEVGPGYSFDVSLSVTQPILRGFGDDTGLSALRSSRVERTRREATRDRTASELVRDVIVAYWELWYAQSALEVQRANVELAETQYREAQARSELGTLARPDVLSFATRMASANESMVAAENERIRRALELSRLLGGRPVDGLDESSPPSASALGDELVGQVVEASLTIKEKRSAVDAAREALRTAGADLEPRLDLRGELAVHGLGYDDVGQTFETAATFSAVTGSLNLDFELPLDDARRRSELERARIAIDVAEADLRATVQQVETQTRQLLSTLREARQRLELARETASLAEELAEAERGRFEFGTNTAIAVLEAENQHRDAQLRVLRASVDIATADAQLAHHSGELIDRVDLE